MTGSHSTWPAVALASAALACLLVVIGGGSVVRSAAVLWFVLVCPGLAVVRVARLDDRLAEAALAVAASLAIAGVASGALMYARWWSPPRVLAVLVAVTVAGVAVEARTDSPGRSRGAVAARRALSASEPGRPLRPGAGR